MRWTAPPEPRCLPQSLEIATFAMYSRGSSGRPTRDPSDTIVSGAKHEDTRGAKSACLYLWCSESTDGPRSTLKIPLSNTRIFTIDEDRRRAILPPNTIVYYILEEVRRTDGQTLPVLLFFLFSCRTLFCFFCFYADAHAHAAGLHLRRRCPIKRSEPRWRAITM